MPVRYKGGGGGAAPPPSGTANFLPPLTTGPVLTNKVTGTPARPVISTGTVLTQAPSQLRSALTTGLTLLQRLTSTITPPLTTGSSLTPVLKMTIPPSSLPGSRVTQITYSLTHRRGGSTVVTSTGWTSPANSIDGTDGIHNGTTATAAGGLSASTDTLILSYPTQSNRTQLTITSVKLYFYIATSTTVLVTTANLSYSLDSGGSFTALGSTLTGGLVIGTPQIFDITAAVAGSWTSIAALQTKFLVAFGAASAAENVACDAIEVEVIANRTDLF